MVLREQVSFLPAAAVATAAPKARHHLTGRFVSDPLPMGDRDGQPRTWFRFVSDDVVSRGDVGVMTVFNFRTGIEAELVGAAGNGRLRDGNTGSVFVAERVIKRSALPAPVVSPDNVQPDDSPTPPCCLRQGSQPR
jgi:hypothetical protein